MRKLDHILFINLGQAGLQIATSFWELICIEQGIGPDGLPLETNDVLSDNDTSSSLFNKGNNNNYIPRAVFIDSDPIVIDEIQTGAYKKLFNQEMMIKEKEDAANNYARGSYTIGKKIISKVKHKIRKLVEKTDSLTSFFILNSTSGGTGSGLSPLVMLTLMIDYPKITKSAFSIAPGYCNSNAVVEPYNSILYNYAASETCDFNVVFENQSIYNLASKKLNLNSPTYVEINRILAMMLSSISAPLRYPATLRSSLHDMLTNLIPYPTMHYSFTRYAPIKHISKSFHENLTTIQLTKELFSSENQFINVDTEKGLFISMVINFQGLVNTTEIYKAIEQQKLKNKNKFVDWSPTGFKIGISNQFATISPLLDLCPSDKSGTMLINSTAIKSFFIGLMRKFELLYSKKSFLYWYFGEGMEELEFTEARDNVNFVINDFREIEMSDKNKNKKDRI